MTTPADDITPEELAEMERDCSASCVGGDCGPDHHYLECPANPANTWIATQRRLLAALRRRDARIEELSVSHDKFYRAYDAANAKLARAVALLNRSRGGTTTDDDAITAFLAEIEAEHGK